MQQNLFRYFEELQRLCAIDSNSYHKPGLDAMVDYLARRLSNLGMNTTIIERETWGNDLLGVIQGNGGGNILLIGHTDTVYPVHTATPLLRVENDKVYGPGVCDMKGGLLLALYAIEALQKMNFRDFGEIRFLCVSDEEIIQRHCQDVMQRACQGCQGALVLEAARLNGDIVSARKGTTWYTLTARGKAAHAGTEPENGRNAILELAHQILQFQTLYGWCEGITITPGVIQGGITPNVVPDYAFARIDLRFLHPQDRYDTETQWRTMMQKQLISEVTLTLETEPGIKEPMVRTKAGEEFALLAQSIASSLGLSINHILAGGSSDAAYPSYYGIPVLDGLGPIGGLDHSPGEYMLISSVASRAALLAGLIASIGARIISPQT